MPVDRSLWRPEFSRDSIPRFPCPICRGRLLPDEGSLFISEPPHSKRAVSHPDWDPDWIENRFSMRLTCPDPECGEIVLVTGDTTMIEVYDDEGPTNRFEDALRPRAMFPAPPVVTIPDSCPSDVMLSVKAAFGLFWTDRHSAANRLRVGVEFLLDDLQVPRAGTKPDGKTFEMNLHNRIEAFAKREPDHDTTLHALRVIGNLGSHGSIKLVELLDGFDLMEELLAEIVGKRSAYLDALKARILSTKRTR